ncbi:MAG: DUF1993 domain-containing protein [Betaproteobacteria bacterium]|nr:DUF1993 domain-containing protein [Betaproteobacteria bacterium]
MASMYKVSIPVYIRRLNGLAICLKKAQEVYAEKKYDESSLLSQRLFPDMFTFAKQVQSATDHARTSGARLAGMEPPTVEANEKSIADLIARIDNTVAFLGTLKPDQIDGSEDKTIAFKVRGNDVTYKGLDFLLNTNMPNFYFHMAAAYNILRANGVEIGKRDFMGPA